MPESGEISERKGAWWALQIWQAPQGGGLEGIQGEEEAWPEAEGGGGMTLWSGPQEWRGAGAPGRSGMWGY